MGDMFKMIKQAANMRKQVKKIEKELQKFTAEGVSGYVKVVVLGDMTVKSVEISPEGMDPSRREKLQSMIVSATNNAIRNARKQAGAEMAKMTGGIGGLSELFGG